jgi:hypothetical protein
MTDEHQLPIGVLELVQHASASFNGCFFLDLPEDILELEGMSGKMTRKFYNMLCKIRCDGRKLHYLEVGSWKGSSLISAMHGNTEHVNFTAVDNWAEFDGPKDEFLKNLASFKLEPTIIESDFLKYTPDKFIDVYLYDGAHDYESQYKAITHMWPYLHNNAIVVIDDWNCEEARMGTMDGFRDVGANLFLDIQLKYDFNSYKHGAYGMPQGFWNGIGVFVVSKTKLNS